MPDIKTCSKCKGSGYNQAEHGPVFCIMCLGRGSVSDTGKIEEEQFDLAWLVADLQNTVHGLTKRIERLEYEQFD